MSDYSLISYGQEGEDIVLKRIFECCDSAECGFYVDIGAHHPQRFSNTYFFYKLGWKGINVDATPGSMLLFNQMRERDINIEYAVSNKEEELTYYMFNEPALNGFDYTLSKFRDSLDSYNIKKSVTLNTVTLESILDKYLPDNLIIDFLTIDVEGLDFQVLQSNNWNKYRPRVILIEILYLIIDESIEDPVSVYMREKGYVFYAKTVGTHFYLEKDFYNTIDNRVADYKRNVK